MNLFFLDHDPDVNAMYHIDKHVVKMVLEVAEMLSMAHWVTEAVGFVPRKLTTEEYQKVVEYKRPWKNHDPEDRPIPYVGQNSHLNHPSTIWVRSSLDNYFWAFVYMQALEYERRFRNPRGVPEHRAHKLCMEKLKEIDIPSLGETKFPLAMNTFKEKFPEFINEDDPVATYRYFYMADKGSFASWKKRDKPSWWDDEWAAAHALR